MQVVKFIELKNRINEIVARYATFSEDGAQSKDFSPPSDVYIDGKREIMFIELPNIDIDSLNTNVKNSVLSLKCKRVKIDRSSRKYLHIERMNYSYSKEFKLSGDSTNIKSIDNSYKRGVLKIIVNYGD